MSATSKIIPLDELAALIKDAKQTGRRVAHCHGVFDLMHLGHIRHFEAARKFGDLLVVTITEDRYVNKGPHRPVFGQELRAESIAALASVDYVAVNRWPSAVETIKLLEPSFYVKGSDYRDAAEDRTGGIVKEREAVESVGGQLVFTDEITFSSSNLINRHMQPFPQKVKDYLTAFGAEHSAKEVNGYLEKARGLKVLVVGEAIIDEYSYCKAIGKSSKEPIVALRHNSTEKFAGGSLAVANHVSNFCDDVALLTVLGRQNPQTEYITESLNDNVERLFLYRDDAPTIVKRRYLDDYFYQKLLEVYEMNDRELSGKADEQLRALLDTRLSDFDLVIAIDFGHGMISRKAIDVLCDKATFLAVNTQSNAGNIGYHTISKYPRADYICIAHNETMLEQKDRECDTREAIAEISEKLRCPQMTITMGNKGTMCRRTGEGIIEAPALAGQVVDRIGAGDAVLSITALLAQIGVPIDVLGFVANAVGAQAVSTVCNRSPIDPVSLARQIESLLK